MDGEQNKEVIKLNATIKRTPLDAKIIGGLLFFSGFLGVLFGVLLVIGIGQIAGEGRIAILLGLSTVGPKLGYGVYNIISSMFILIGSYGLIRGRKYGWWVMISFCAYFFLDSALSGMYAPIWIFFIYGSVTLWLLFRRNIYGIKILK